MPNWGGMAKAADGLFDNASEVVGSWGSRGRKRVANMNRYAEGGASPDRSSYLAAQAKVKALGRRRMYYMGGAVGVAALSPAAQRNSSGRGGLAPKSSGGTTL